MPTLVSPGVQVTIIDESQYAITDGRDTIPLIILATNQDKTIPDGTAIAPSTTEAEAGKVKLMTSPRELVQEFGNPVFFDVNGTVQQGNELNEVGLLTAYKALNVTNRVYVVRADLDLNEMVSVSTAPTSDPLDQTYWFDTLSTLYGVFEFEEGAWVNKIPKLLESSDTVVGGVPVNSFGSNGDYGAVVLNDSGTTGIISYYQKLANVWVKLGSTAWDTATPSVARSTIPFSSPSLATLTGLPQAGDTIIFDVDASLSPDTITLDSIVDGTATLATSNTLALQTVILNGVTTILGTSAGKTLASSNHVSDTAAVTGLTVADVLRITDDAGFDDISMNITVVGSGFNATGLAGSMLVNGVTVSMTGVTTAAELNTAITAALASSPQGLTISDDGSEVTLTKTSNVTGENNPNQIVTDISLISGGDTGFTTLTTNMSIIEVVTSITAQVSNTDNITASVTGSFVINIIDSATGLRVSSQLGDPVTDLGWAVATSVTPTEIETEIELATTDIEVDDAAGNDVPLAGERLRLIFSGTGDFTVGAGTANTPLGLTAAVYRVSLNSIITQFIAGQSFGNTTATLDTNGTANFMVITNTASLSMQITGTASVKLGFPTSVSTSTLFFATHTNVPSTPEEGDVWIKTTTPNLGGDYVVKLFTTASGQFTIVDAPMYTSNVAAFDAFATALTTGSLYVRYDNAGTGEAEFIIRRYNGSSTLVLTEANFAGSGAANILVGNGRAAAAVVAVDDASTFVTAVNGLGQLNLEAENTGGNVIIRNTAGEDIVLADGTAAVAAILPSLTAGTFSNWIPFSGSDVLSTTTVAFTASQTAPVGSPAEGQLWYNATVSNAEIDLLVNDDALNTWIDYAGDLQISATRPSFRADGTSALQADDIWLDSSDLDNYPVLRRWEITTGGKWVVIDKTDQTSTKGIVFQDARPTSTANLDPDSPNPLLFPAGMLLWNTRASSMGVREWRGEWFNDDTSAGLNFADVNYTETTYVVGNDTLSALSSAGRWVTVSSNKLDGSPNMGRKAQRIMVVQGLGASITGNTDLRDIRRNFFNLILTPGYPELLDEMVTLNIDRKETAFIIGDTPKRLENNSTEIQAWVTNANNAASNGEDGLVTRYIYSADYYPPLGLTTNLDGKEVAVSTSLGALYAYLFNDNVAFPWFAPAGVNRGLLSGVFTSVGALNSEEEFEPQQISQGLQDVLYTNNLNPIVFSPSRGLYVNGQKTLSPTVSALDRVNVARLIVFLRFQLEILAEEFLFETNDNLTRDSVKDTFDRFLADLLGLRAIFDFLVVVDESNNTPERIDRNELWIDIAIQPAKAIEFIYIPIRVKNTGEDLTA